MVLILCYSVLGVVVDGTVLQCVGSGSGWF